MATELFEEKSLSGLDFLTELPIIGRFIWLRSSKGEAGGELSIRWTWSSKDIFLDFLDVLGVSTTSPDDGAFNELFFFVSIGWSLFPSLTVPFSFRLSRLILWIC